MYFSGFHLLVEATGSSSDQSVIRRSPMGDKSPRNKEKRKKKQVNKKDKKQGKPGTISSTLHTN
jgi:hypothetical protein